MKNRGFFTFEALISLILAIAIISQIHPAKYPNYSELEMQRTAGNIIDILTKNKETLTAIQTLTLNYDEKFEEHLRDKIIRIGQVFPNYCIELKIKNNSIKDNSSCNKQAKMTVIAARTIYFEGNFERISLELSL